MSQIEDYFAGKPASRSIFDAIHGRIASMGSIEVTVASQITFGSKRKFAWFWLYNVTSRTPNGVPHLMLAIDEPLADPHVRQVNQISARRWNHQVVVRTIEDAQSDWLGFLLERAYAYGSRAR